MTREMELYALNNELTDLYVKERELKTKIKSLENEIEQNPPMTYQELSQIFRVEKNEKSLCPIRRDFYWACKDLCKRLRQEYERELSIDSTSNNAQRVNQERKKAETQYKYIRSLRLRKICNMAVLEADGGLVPSPELTPEEVVYYTAVSQLSRRHLIWADAPASKRDPYSNVPIYDEATIKEILATLRLPYGTPIDHDLIVRACKFNAERAEREA